MNRRDFLKVCAVTTVSSALPAIAFVPVRAEDQVGPLQTYGQSPVMQMIYDATATGDKERYFTELFTVERELIPRPDMIGMPTMVSYRGVCDQMPDVRWEYIEMLDEATDSTLERCDRNAEAAFQHIYLKKIAKSA